MTWVLKIDDEFEGRGLAYVELGKSKIILSLLKKGNYSYKLSLISNKFIILYNRRCFLTCQSIDYN